MTAPKLANLALWGQANAAFEGRAYRHPHTGVQYPSVTNILKQVDKSSLAQYAATKTLEWAVANVDSLLSKSEEAGVRSGQYRWKDHSNERAMVGDGIHTTIESLQSGKWEFPELDDEQKRILEQWELLNQKHVIKPILNEFTVFGELGYMGTADAYAEIDGELCLIDYKTSKSIWEDHWLQLSALWHAEHWLIETGNMVWEDQAPQKIERVALIHLRADFAEIHYADEADEDMSDNYAIFAGYHNVWAAREAKKSSVKSRKAASFGGF